MASLEAIRGGIKTTLEDAIPGLHGYAMVPGAASLPAFVVTPETANFVVAMGRGADSWEFELAVLCSASDLGLGQARLDELVSGAGPGSIRQAIFNRRSLGLGKTDAHVAGLAAYGLRFEATEINHIGATLRLVVHTSGTE